MFCPVCGSEVPDNTVFCPVCGTTLREEAAEPEPAEVKENRCPHCGAVMPEGALFCASCGKRMIIEEPEKPAEPAAPVCPNCGTKLPEGALFCAACGTRLAIPEIVQEEDIPVVTEHQEVIEEIPDEETPVPEEVPVIAETEEMVEAVAEEVPAEPEPAPETVIDTADPEETPDEVIAEPAKPAAPVCPTCGTALPEGALFCAVCGTRLAIPESVQEEDIPLITEHQELIEEIPDEVVSQPEEAPVTAEETPKEAAPETVIGTAEPEVIPAPAVTEPVKTGGPVCPTCGTPLPDGAKFCAVCGTRFGGAETAPEPAEQPGTFCPKCGTKLPAGSAFCNNCGYNLITGASPQSAPVTKAAPAVKMPNIDLKKFSVLKDMLIHPDKETNADLPVSICTLIAGIIINSLTLRNFYTLLFNAAVEIVKRFGIDAKSAEIRQARREMAKYISNGKIILWGILITVLLFALITLFSILVKRGKEEKIDIAKHLSTAARIMFAPMVLLLLALIFSFVPAVSFVLIFIAFMLFLVLIIDLLKRVQIWPRTLLFVLIAFAVIFLFSKGFAAGGEAIFDEMLDGMDLDDLLYYML